MTCFVAHPALYVCDGCGREEMATMIRLPVGWRESVGLVDYGLGRALEERTVHYCGDHPITTSNTTQETTTSPPIGESEG